MNDVISQGAEATVSRTADGVLKQRLSKSYRHPQIDHSLQQFRTRREAKVLSKLGDVGFPAPRLHAIDDERHELLMSALQGPVMRTILNDNPVAHGAEIGTLIGRLHAAGIVHGDLTTSNMILAQKKIHLIDFGLSAFSETEEDRAVDLHVLREALEAKHSEVFRPCYDSILDAYQKTHPFAAAVLERLKKVELRGKNKKNY
ncbi:MAG: KEOPS complex kinase/ATPase Bud32 [Candidatus Woesearchaeota archaeon]|nr:KEOPS complex kinase/ATPase Bud32 [Candidatus Woesearchaeota archaeon]